MEPVAGAQPPGRGNPLGSIAFWQFLLFFMLVCLIWVDQILDLPSLLYGMPPSPVNWIGASILTACVIVVGLITIGYSYEQQKRVFRGMFKICSYCNKVQINEEAWQRLDLFVSDKTRAQFSHGVCPECFKKVVAKAQGKSSDSTVSAIRGL